MAGSSSPDPLVIAGREFRSRLIMGTGKFPDMESMNSAYEAAGAEMVTVALRRVESGADGEDVELGFMAEAPALNQIPVPGVEPQPWQSRVFFWGVQREATAPRRFGMVAMELS